MSNFSASIPAASMAAANTTLQNAGYGPGNFSIPCYVGANPNFGLLHCWANAAFQAAVTAIAGVVVQEGVMTSPGDAMANPPIPPSYDLTPTVVAAAAATARGAALLANAKPLTGSVTPGLYRDAQGGIWSVIQAYDTATYPDPTVIPALIRKTRIPGVITEWVQPLDQFDAFKLINPFTNKPDTCTHNGQTWKVTQGDGAGNNVWTPGVFGWTQS